MVPRHPREFDSHRCKRYRIDDMTDRIQPYPSWTPQLVEKAVRDNFYTQVLEDPTETRRPLEVHLKEPLWVRVFLHAYAACFPRIRPYPYLCDAIVRDFFEVLDLGLPVVHRTRKEVARVFQTRKSLTSTTTPLGYSSVGFWGDYLKRQKHPKVEGCLAWIQDWGLLRRADIKSAPQPSLHRIRWSPSAYWDFSELVDPDPSEQTAGTEATPVEAAATPSTPESNEPRVLGPWTQQGSYFIRKNVESNRPVVVVEKVSALAHQGDPGEYSWFRRLTQGGSLAAFLTEMDFLALGEGYYSTTTPFEATEVEEVVLGDDYVWVGSCVSLNSAPRAASSAASDSDGDR